MTLRSLLLSLCLMSVALLLFFQFSQRQLANPWEQLVLDSQFRDLLVRNMNQERLLAALQPEQAERHKTQFLEVQAMLAHLEILETNRDKITRRYQMVLLALIGGSLGGIVMLLLYRRLRLEGHLREIDGYLARLAAGETDLRVPIGGRDVLGRIAEMIQTTSTVMARSAQRLKALDHLEAWQESSRRMAHEIRTPLTTLRLEIDKLLRTATRLAPEAAPAILAHEHSIREELGHLAAFTDQYTSFAKVGKPQLKPMDPHDFLQEFVELYSAAWPNLKLIWSSPPGQTTSIAADKRLIRQVLVNLCNNSSKALAESKGTVSFSLQQSETRILLGVADSGPGVEPAIRGRLFQPYVTTRAVGEGTGLGLAISRKIMLDHGGDLELLTGTGGACFQLVFPLAHLKEHEA